MMIFKLLFLVLLFTLPGAAVWAHASPRLRDETLPVERLFLLLLSGVALVSWLSILLAGMGIFSLPLLTGILLAGSAVGGFWGLRRRGTAPWRRWNWSRQAIWFVLILLIGLFLSPQPHEYIVGGRDHGVYINTGMHIAQSGSIKLVDPVLPALPAELRPLLVRPETRLWKSGFPGPWSAGLHLTGLTIQDLDNGIVLPHGFHLYPALIAVFAAVGGASWALWTTPLLLMLGAGGFFLTLRRWWGEAVALGSAALLMISVTQIWFTRYPAAEAMVLFFFWGGLLAALLMFKLEERWPAVIAALCFGLLHLVKMDMLHLAVLLAIFFAVLWARGKYRPVFNWFWAVYLLLLLHTLLHAFFVATVYFLDHFLRNLLPRFAAEEVVRVIDGRTLPGEILTAVAGAYWYLLPLGMLLLGLSLGLRRPLQRFLQNPRWTIPQPRLILTLLILAYAGLLGTSLFWTTAPLSVQLIYYAVELTALYLTRPLTLLAFGGLLVMLWQTDRLAERFALWLPVGIIAPYYLLGPGTAPDHFWVIRRFVPIAFPFLMMATVLLLHAFWMATRQRWAILRLPWIPLVVLLVLGGRMALDSLPILPVVDYDGLTTQLNELARNLPDDAVLLIPQNDAAVRIDLPLWILHGRAVYTIREEVLTDPAFAEAVSALQSLNRPVYWLLNGAQNPVPPRLPNLDSDAVFTFEIQTPLLETPLDRIPRAVSLFELQLTAYEIR